MTNDQRQDAPPPAVGFILAGGLASRMGGGDKSLIEAGGETMLARVVARLAGQCQTVVLNANGDPARFAHFGLPVAADVVEGYCGPLAGVLTGLEWLRRCAPNRRWLLTVAADTPLFPLDLASRLASAAATQGAEIAVARSGDRTHPAFGLWSVELAADLRRAIEQDGERRLNAWAKSRRLATVAWPTTPYDPFFNVNTPEDAAELRRMLSNARIGDAGASP
ncbi:MAG TPA: molybdenum cofactor guanylyltransferase MobA [Azospirillaceae bacterium]|nr:molybdenum cofactor guanylyltransferase MobA [Azospirillaceae bacterium]HRQ82681.1 molybdenum cofactor guanylyltransferase MobA [Azospirillaceae bacterium]